jgi:hypothetical protein
MMADSAVGPRFRVGDQITVVGPGINNGDTGEVSAITIGFDSIYRYEVHLEDGTTTRYFGFELQLNRGESKVA